MLDFMIHYDFYLSSVSLLSQVLSKLLIYIYICTWQYTHRLVICRDKLPQWLFLNLLFLILCNNLWMKYKDKITKLYCFSGIFHCYVQCYQIPFSSAGNTTSLFWHNLLFIFHWDTYTIAYRFWVCFYTYFSYVTDFGPCQMDRHLICSFPW